MQFEVTLRPDPLARQLVTGLGLLLTLTGVLILAMSQLPLVWRLAGLLVWLLKAIRDYLALRDGYRRVFGIVIDTAGTVSALSETGERVPARSLAGSFVLSEFAWIRLRLPGGPGFGELMIRRRMCVADWHRLSLAWQLGRRSFGHRGPA